MERLLYHGTANHDLLPIFGGGREYHDYGKGFYTTEDIEAAKEWACQGERTSSYVYQYAFDTNGLALLTLDEDCVLEWVSILMTYRRGRRIRAAALDRCLKLIELYGIDIEQHDAICGFRANDSYFQFTTDFITDTITLDTLQKSIKAGDLGYQLCIKSKKAYQHLKLIDKFEMKGSDYLEYHHRYVTRDNYARELAETYSTQKQTGKLLSEILQERSHT
jgi:hypothetical protein